METSLVLPVYREARFGDLDNKRGPGWVFAAVVSARPARDGDIGFRLRVVCERDQPLGPYEPTGSDAARRASSTSPIAV
jgi:hypothetical protein